MPSVWSEITPTLLGGCAIERTPRYSILIGSVHSDSWPARSDASGDLITVMAEKMSELKAPSGVDAVLVALDRIGSANPTPFKVVRAKVPGRPRRLIVALRESASRLICTPGRRWIASPTFRSGNRPRPSEEIESVIWAESRLVLSASA